MVRGQYLVVSGQLSVDRSQLSAIRLHAGFVRVFII